MATCLIGLGSNVGDRRASLDRAVAALHARDGLRVLACSRWYPTRPVGGPPGQSEYLNGAMVLETSLEPPALLGALQDVEQRLGRRRTEHWGPRPIDLDLLLYDRVILQQPGLTVPHPRMAFRRFVLETASEVASAMLHPLIGWTISELLEHLNGPVTYVAITGPPGVGKTRLVEQLWRQGHVQWLRQEGDAGAREHVRPSPLCHACPSAEQGPMGSSGDAWATELQWLHVRQRVLAADRSEWRARNLAWASDFWFDQSLAYAAVHLAADQESEYRKRWEEARQHIVRPKLTVLLDSPMDDVRERLGCEVRAAWQGWEAQWEAIRARIRGLVTRPGTGPSLVLPTNPPEQVLEEVAAAIASMR